MTMTERPTINYSITRYGEGIPQRYREELERESVSAKMIALTPEVLESHQRGVVATSGTRLVGYAALASEYLYYNNTQGEQYRAVELGGALVVPDFQRMGVATTLWKKRLGLMREDESYADDTRLTVFANDLSRKYVDPTPGFRPLEEGETLDVAAFQLCRGCTTREQIGPQPWQDPTVCCAIGGIRIAVLGDLRQQG